MREPLLHWLPKPLHRRALTALGHGFYADEANLNLLSATALRRRAREAGITNPTVGTARLFGWPTNLLLFARR